MPAADTIVVRVETFREGDVYVTICPDLQVSSFGDTPDEARRSFREALEAFVEECEAMGTLEEVLEEAGFRNEHRRWLSRQAVSAELIAIG